MPDPRAFRYPFDPIGTNVLYTEEPDRDPWNVSNNFWEDTVSKLSRHKDHTHGHLGEDWVKSFSVSAGAEVRAIADGVVVYSSWDLPKSHPDFGNLVIISHDVSDNEGLNVDTVYSLYAHLKDPNKNEKGQLDFNVGDTVDAGDLIGWIGKTGSGAEKSDPHLHLEILSGDWSGYINGTGLKGYDEKPTSDTPPPTQWYDPSDFIDQFGGLYGKTVDYSWYFPNEQTRVDTQDVLVGPTVELAKLTSTAVLSFGTVDFHNDSIVFWLGYEPNQGGISFGDANSQFVGPQITDVYNAVPDFVDVKLLQNGGNVSLDQSDISFDANHVSVNLQGLSFYYGSQIELGFFFHS